MATASPATASRLVQSARDPAAAEIWPFGAVLREVASGGLAGLLAGIVVAGIGGRIAMRLAALLVPSAAGFGTENGNRIGDITFEGTAALIVFEGLAVGVVGGFLWVTLRPWMPARPLPRLLLAMVASVAIGAFVLIEGTNPDFRILGFSPAVVAVLVALVALFGLAVASLELLLARRLPAARPRSRAVVAYAVVTILGLALGLALVVPALLLGWLRPLGITLAVTGVATLAWWWLRTRGATTPPRAVALLGHGALATSILIGLWFAVPEIAAALGMG